MKKKVNEVATRTGQTEFTRFSWCEERDCLFTLVCGRHDVFQPGMQVCAPGSWIHRTWARVRSPLGIHMSAVGR